MEAERRNWAARLRRSGGNFFNDIAKLVVADRVEGFLSFLEFLVDLDGVLLHHLVSVLRAAEKMEILPVRDAGVAVIVVKPKAQQDSFRLRIHV